MSALGWREGKLEATIMIRHDRIIRPPTGGEQNTPTDGCGWGICYVSSNNMMRLPKYARTLLYSFLIMGIFFLLIGISPVTSKGIPATELKVIAAKQSQPPTLYIGASVPSALRDEASKWNLLYADDPQAAAVTLDFAKTDEASSVWVYALVAPFPTVTDDVSSRDLLDFWRG